MPDIGAIAGVGFVQLSITEPTSSGSLNLFDQVLDIAHIHTVQKESFNTWKVANHHVTTKVPSILQRQIDPLFTDVPTYVWVRMGILSQSDAQTYWRPWEKRVVTAFDATRPPGGYDPALGHEVWIETADLLYPMQYGENTKVRSGTISDIVTEIIKDQKNGLDANAIIEPTDSKGVYVQSFQSDFDFITKRMIPRAVNKDGRGGYHLAVIDGVLHFHTVGYSTKGIQSKPIDYFSQQGRAIDLHQVNRMPLQMVGGAAGIVAVVADPLQLAKESVGNADSSDSKTLVLTPTGQGFQVNPPEGYTKNIVLHAYENGVGEVAAQAQNEFDKFYQTQYCIKFNYRNQPQFRLFDFIDITFDRSTSWSGTWYVGNLIQDMNEGILMTTCTVYRGQRISDTLSGTLVSRDQNSSQVKSLNVPKGVQPDSFAATSTVISQGGGGTIQVGQ